MLRRSSTIALAAALIALTALPPACAEKLTVSGPQPVGPDVNVRLGGGAAELTIGTTYEAPTPRALTIVTTMRASGDASLGEITSEASVDGFEVAQGRLTWTSAPTASAPAREVLRLSPTGATDRPILRMRHLRGGQEVGSSELRFVATTDELRPCRAADPRCG